jgi:hypothetical protein
MPRHTDAAASQSRRKRGASVVVPDVNCAGGKVPFRTYEAATRAAMRIGGERGYLCPACGYFHVTTHTRSGFQQTRARRIGNGLPSESGFDFDAEARKLAAEFGPRPDGSAEAMRIIAAAGQHEHADGSTDGSESVTW